MAAYHDLSGLMKWMHRPEWADAFQEVFLEHVGPACEEAGVDAADLEEVLGNDLVMMLFGCAFEDFLTHTFGEEERNIVDEYLKRRGWKESVPNRRYMTALRDSEMSLYEVSEVVPAQSFVARDLVRGGPPIRVSEHTATKMLQVWDRIATRIVEVNGKAVMTGGTLPFDHTLSEAVLRELRGAKRRVRRTIKDVAHDLDEPIDPKAQRALADLLVSTSSAPVFSGFWLEDALNRVLHRRMPDLINNDGDTIEFCEMRFPLRPGASAEQVRERLDSIATLRPESDGFWGWVEMLTDSTSAPRATPRDGAPGAVLSTTLTDDGGLSLGTIELIKTAVLLTTNSRARADRGQALLMPALAGLVDTPLTKIQTMAQLQAERPAKSPPPASSLPPEVQTEIIHGMLEKHYRAQLDQPVPALGNISPRAAAKTPSGRKKLVGWLKYLENQSLRMHVPDDPMGSYDFSWMWTELGVEGLRK